MYTWDSVEGVREDGAWVRPQGRQAGEGKGAGVVGIPAGKGRAEREKITTDQEGFGFDPR